MSSNTVSVDFSAAGKHKHDAVQNILAEARRLPRPDGNKWTEYVHPERSEKNVMWQNPLWGGDWEKAVTSMHTSSRKIRSDAVWMRAMIFQVSPDWAFPKIAEEGWTQEQIDDPNNYAERGVIDVERVNAWWKTMLKWLQKKYGDCLLEAHLHMDEGTPHIHAEIIPVVDGTLNNKVLLGKGKKGCKDFVTELATVCHHLGLVRAKEMSPDDPPKKHGTYTSPALMAQEANERQKSLEIILKKGVGKKITEDKSTWPEPFRREIPEPEKGIFGVRESDQKEYDKARQKKHTDSVKWLEKNRVEKRILKDALTEKSGELEMLRQRVMALEKSNTELREKLDAPQQDLRQLADRFRTAIDLESMLQNAGFWLDTKASTATTKMYRSGDESDRKVAVSGHFFIDNHDPRFRGFGAIDLQLCLDHGAPLKKHFAEAVGRLKNVYTDAALGEEILFHPAPKSALAGVAANIAEKIPKAELPPLPEADSGNKTKQVRQWCDSRGISPQIFEDLARRKQLFIDEKGNIVVPRLHGGFFARGTYGADNKFRQTIGGAACGAAYLSGAKATEKSPLILCESVSDALALLQTFPTHHVAITGGNLHPEIEAGNREIYLAFDNDKMGEAHVKHYSELLGKVRYLRPPACKDWSEFVQQKMTGKKKIVAPDL